jgi:cell division protein FtsW
VTTFLDPFASLQGSGFQGGHSRLALATGGWWGLGLGASRQKWGNLPEAHTDFIFAVLGEELGLVGTLLVLALFLTIAYAGLRVATQTDHLFIR